jgi:hypothetical protein
MSKRGLAAMSKTEQKMPTPTRAVVIFAYDGAQLIDYRRTNTDADNR